MAGQVDGGRRDRVASAAATIVVTVAVTTVLTTVAGGVVRAGDDPPSSPPAAADGVADEAPRPVVAGTIEVVAKRPEVPAVTVLVPSEHPPFGDGGEALAGAPGVSGGRMGGHGFDPVVRGLGAASLNVWLDGAAIQGGCPNRMDPQTSFAASSSYDEAVVIRGVQTLRYGAGGTAGTVLYERLPPSLDPARGWRVALEGIYGSVLDGPAGRVDLALGGERGWLRVLAGRHAQHDYEDGDGRTVRSAFDSRSRALIGSWKPAANSRLELSVETARTDDALFAGAGMDAPEDAADIVRLGFETRLGHDRRVGLEAQVYGDRVDHLMDNYSLRPLTASMAMRVPASSDSAGGRLRLDLAPGVGWQLVGGLDYDRNRRRATRFAGPSPAAVVMAQSVMWPDVTTTAAGGFVEAGRVLGARSRLRFGVRLDGFSAGAATPDQPTMGGNGPTPRQLWTATYGAANDQWEDTALGALLRWEWRGEAVELFAGASRSARAPDATERYLAANSPDPRMRWVGNPGLAMPRHHQLDLGLVWHGTAGRVALTAFGDEVSDFVLRDRARGQDGVAAADLRSIYRTVDARRVGAELEAATELGRGFGLTVVTSWVRADDRTDHRPIAQTPPLEGALGATWAGGVVSVAATVRWADRQDRIDDDPLTGSGLDADPTPGWAVLDLSAGLELGAGLALTVGIDNVLDATYARHLNRGSLFDPVPVQVNEPGRTTWLRLAWRSARGYGRD